MLGQPILHAGAGGCGLPHDRRPWPRGVTATDLVLRVVEMLRRHGVVGKVRGVLWRRLGRPVFGGPGHHRQHGPGIRRHLRLLSHRRGNTIHYLELTGRFTGNRGRWWRHTPRRRVCGGKRRAAAYTDTLGLDLATVAPSLAGPQAPSGPGGHGGHGSGFRCRLGIAGSCGGKRSPRSHTGFGPGDWPRHRGHRRHSPPATNTSNPAVMPGRPASWPRRRCSGACGYRLGSRPPWRPAPRWSPSTWPRPACSKPWTPWDSTWWGYGCTTCIGNSGPLPEAISQAIDGRAILVGVFGCFRGNRQFRGAGCIRKCGPTGWPRRCWWWPTPCAGTTRIDLSPRAHRHGVRTAIRCICGTSGPATGKWPRRLARSPPKCLARAVRRWCSPGRRAWAGHCSGGQRRLWVAELPLTSSRPPFFSVEGRLGPVRCNRRRRVLALLGDSVTTDHISPAGAIQPDSPAGQYLQQQGVDVLNFNSYGSRRGNHEVMMRGTFANIRIRNEMTSELEGRLQHPRAVRRTVEHLRRGHALSGRRHSLGGGGRQGVRHRLQPRLGGQGPPACSGCERSSPRASSASTVPISSGMGCAALGLQ